MEGEPSFLPAQYSTRLWGQGSPYGRTLHFGIREHAMGAILNGIALHGGTRAYGGTFLVFSDYMRPAVRLAALMRLPVVYVWTHDSIGLGEDGPPTSRWSTSPRCGRSRARRVRPADANETAWAWRTVLEHPDRPAGLVPHPAESARPRPLRRLRVRPRRGRHAAAAYVLAADDEAAGGTPAVVLVGTGSEVQLALDARRELQEAGHPRPGGLDALPGVVRRAGRRRTASRVLPPAVRARVASRPASRRAGATSSATPGAIVSLEHFGASADYETLYREFGITAEAVVAAARESIAAARS